jgi:hypothetical protein
VEAGVGGFRSPGTSAMELLPVDWGVCGPCKDPELAGSGQEEMGEETRGYQVRSLLIAMYIK